jgi:hypothetical protein
MLQGMIPEASLENIAANAGVAKQQSTSNDVRVAS